MCCFVCRVFLLSTIPWHRNQESSGSRSWRLLLPLLGLCWWPWKRVLSSTFFSILFSYSQISIDSLNLITWCLYGLAVFSCWRCIQWLKAMPNCQWNIRNVVMGPSTGRNRRKRVKSGSRSNLFDPFRILLKQLLLTAISTPIRYKIENLYLYSQSQSHVSNSRACTPDPDSESWPIADCFVSEATGHAMPVPGQQVAKANMESFCCRCEGVYLVSVTTQAAKATKVYALLTFHVRQVFWCFLHVLFASHILIYFFNWIGITIHAIAWFLCACLLD